MALAVEQFFSFARERYLSTGRVTTRLALDVSEAEDIQRFLTNRH